MQFRLPIIAFSYLLGRICCQALGSFAYTACYTVHLIFSPTHPSCSPAPAACRRLSGCLPGFLFRLLAGAHVSYLYGCLPGFQAACRSFRLLACPSGCCRTLSLLACPSGCLPDFEAACLPLRVLAAFRGCSPVPPAACRPSPRVIRGIPSHGCSLMFVSVCQIVLSRQCLVFVLFSVNCCRTCTSSLLSG